MPNNNKFSPKYATILGIKVCSTSIDELLIQIQDKLYKKIQFCILTPNPEIILQAQNEPDLFKALNSAEFSVPDGVGLKLANRSLQIIKGRELMLDLFKMANSQGLKVFFLGTKPEIIKKTLIKIKNEFPNIKAKGNSGPKLDNKANPVSEVDISLQFEIVKEINSFKPDLLFVALGAPKQEIWIDRNIHNLNTIGAMAVGGSLDYYSGFVKPVPPVMEQLNLEWLWRLIQEPQRIGRIFNAVILFPIMVFREKSY